MTESASLGTGSSSTGWYPTGRRTITRYWDGQAWEDQFGTDASAPAMGSQRRGFAMLAHLNFWIVVVSLVLATALAFAWAVTDEAWLQVLASVGVIGTMCSFFRMTWQRLRLWQVIRLRVVLAWGFLAGIVGIAVAVALEAAWAHALQLPKGSAAVFAITGPVEELAKMMVPIVLFCSVKRYRDLRIGVALATASGAFFGLFEGIEYVAGLTLNPKFRPIAHVAVTQDLGAITKAIGDALISRPAVELLHPCLAGFIGAVAWQAARRRGHLVTIPLVGACAIAMIVHSTNDVLTTVNPQLSIVASIVLVAGSYFVLFRRQASQTTPPDALPVDPRPWRPLVPRQAQLPDQASP